MEFVCKVLSVILAIIAIKLVPFKSKIFLHLVNKYNMYIRVNITVDVSCFQLKSFIIINH